MRDTGVTRAVRKGGNIDMNGIARLPKVRKWGSELGGFGVVNGREVAFNAYGTSAVDVILPMVGLSVGVTRVRLWKKRAK